MRSIKQSTARNVMVLMVDATDHVTGETGLTLTITASKDGAAFASISPTVTERGSGFYNIALTSSHTDTLGDLALHITGTGADPADVVLNVVANLEADTYAIVNSGTHGNAALKTLIDTIDDFLDTEVAAIKAKTDNLPAAPAATGDIPTANANADALLDRAAGVETGLTLRQWLRLGGSVLFGKSSNGNKTFRDFGDTKDRITATVDGSGNRTAVTRDAT